MLPALLALVFAAPPSIWVDPRTSDDPRCTGDALAQAITALLPEAQVRVGTRTDPADLQVSLNESPKGYVLSLFGGPAPFTRILPADAASNCADAVNLSALILSRDLEELPWRGAAPPPLAVTGTGVLPPAPDPSTRFFVDLGLVGTRMAGGISPGLTLDLGLRLGAVFFLLGGDLLLAQHPAIGGSGIQGNWVVQSDPLRAVVGLSLPLGPGDVSLGAGGGVLLTKVSVQSTVLFHPTSGFAPEGFACLTVGYALRLPWQLLLGLRFEERWVPSPSQFFIFVVPDNIGLQTPTFAAALSLLIGREFY